MAYTFSAANSQYLYEDSHPTFNNWWAMSCWFNPVALSTGADQGLFAFTRLLFSQWASCEIGLAANSPRAYASYRGGGSSFTATAPIDLSTGVWYHLLGIFEWVPNTSSHFVQVYLNGGNQAQVNVGYAIGWNGTKYTWIARGMNNAFASASIAEVAFWTYPSNAARFTQTEAQLLASGYSPLGIRPQHLEVYAPLIRERRDLIWGKTFNLGGSPTVSDHPRVLYSSRIHSAYLASFSPNELVRHYAYII